MLAELAQEHGVRQPEWKRYSQKAGWTLRLKRNDRAIVYLTPSGGSFKAAFTLGERAMQEARRSRLPRKIMRILNAARRYAEGTAVRIVVRRPGDVTVVKKLAVIKLEN